MELDLIEFVFINIILTQLINVLNFVFIYFQFKI